MRLEAQIKGGFYAAHPVAIMHVLQTMSTAGDFVNIIDPCCGEGVAIKTVADKFGLNYNRVYACELERERVEIARQLLPKATIAGPVSYFDLGIQKNAFSFMWLNPPFDHEQEGGRSEMAFFAKSVDYLAENGIMAFVCPERISQLNSFRYQFMAAFDDISVVRFPESHRPFNEVCVIGRKSESANAYRNFRMLTKDDPDFSYVLPELPRPRLFAKTELSFDELEQQLSRSELYRHLSNPRDSEIVSPPLSLSKGHLALMLAAGTLDGVVHPEGEPPHVVRGTVKKIQYTKDMTKEENEETGQVVTTTILSERINLTIRAAWQCGKVVTLSQYKEEGSDDNDATEDEAGE